MCPRIIKCANNRTYILNSNKTYFYFKMASHIVHRKFLNASQVLKDSENDAAAFLLRFRICTTPRIGILKIQNVCLS